MNDCKPQRSCLPSKSAPASISLESIVQSYLDNISAGEADYIRFYANQPSLNDAITKAAMADFKGSKFIHQWRIPWAVLENAKDALLKLDYSKIKTFEELHDTVSKTIGPIRGIGDLTVYDTAHRLGAYLKLSPKFVYLHAGAKTGAKHLGLRHRQKRLPVSAFPTTFHKLRPEQIEDCLCIYKRQLKEWKRIRPCLPAFEQGNLKQGLEKAPIF